MKKIKVLVLLSDGVSLKNFGHSGFYKLGIEMGFEVIFLNTSEIDISEYGFKQNWIKNAKPNSFSEFLKAALIRIELNLYKKRFNDDIYKEYRFLPKINSIRGIVKNLLIKLIASLYGSETRALKLRKKIIGFERKTSYFERCKKELLNENPDYLFSTSQRALSAIAPLTAAQDLKIPTATFIYSWDNIPKATTIVTADKYFVWSEYMKKELLKYQSYVQKEDINITGTPQFENHFKEHLLEKREDFYDRYSLDKNKKYICFSGDDITTSPSDPLYLRDVALAIEELNGKGYNLGIIFRRCPVDFSDRYDEVLKEYNSFITAIDPAWTRTGDLWNTITPKPDDLKLQTNIVAHTECVVNLGSSMVFDYAARDKPCAYMNYHYINESSNFKEGVHVYDYVHFKSMPSKSSVLWLSNPNTISYEISKLLSDPKKNVDEAKNWFKTINLHPAQNASMRIWQTIQQDLERI